MTAYGYTRVPGSDRLRTQPVGGGPAAELEALDPAAATGRVVEGEWLARCAVRDRYVPVLLEVYDRLALGQEAHEQAVYGHLYRLALADERNWCRVALKELQQRTRLSERRLNKALAGLVEKGHVRLVERDRRGTLYRVLLPHEVFHEHDGDAVHMPRLKAGQRTSSARTASEKRAADTGSTTPAAESGAETAATAETVLETAGPAETEAAAGAVEVLSRAREKGARAQKTPLVSDSLLDSSTIGALALSFVERFGERPGRTREDVLEEILGRLEEGFDLSQVATELALFGAKAPRATAVSDLARFLERQRA